MGHDCELTSSKGHEDVNLAGSGWLPRVAQIAAQENDRIQHAALTCRKRRSTFSLIVPLALAHNLPMSVAEDQLVRHSTSAVPPESEAAELLGLAQDDFACPICMSMFRDPFVTDCGHSFCFQCITTHLVNRKICPCCSTYATADKIHPNFLLHKVCQPCPVRRKVLSMKDVTICFRYASLPTLRLLRK